MAELGTRCTTEGGAGRELSAHRCARRISIPTTDGLGIEPRNPDFRAPTLWTEGEGHIVRRAIASGEQARRSRGNPCTSGNSLHEEPGDRGDACRQEQAGGGRRRPYALRVRRRGVGAGHRTEGFEQRRETVGGESGGKIPAPSRTSDSRARSAPSSGPPCPWGGRACGKPHDGRQRGSSLRCGISSRWSFCAAAFTPSRGKRRRESTG